MWHNAVGLPDDRGARRTRNCTGPAGNFPFFQVGQSATVGYVNKETLHTSCCLLAKKNTKRKPVHAYRKLAMGNTGPHSAEKNTGILHAVDIWRFF